MPSKYFLGTADARYSGNAPLEHPPAVHRETCTLSSSRYPLGAARTRHARADGCQDRITVAMVRRPPHSGKITAALATNRRRTGRLGSTGCSRSITIGFGRKRIVRGRHQHGGTRRGCCKQDGPMADFELIQADPPPAPLLRRVR
jgi:hypothetical protein